MAHKIYDIFTDLDPLQLTELASETFRAWLSFALGQSEIGEKKLLHGSGRYASAISWRRTGVARVSILADEDAIPEVGAIEYGHPAVDLRAHMLGKGHTHISASGHRYRVLGLRPDQWRPTPVLTNGMIIDTFSGGRLRRATGRMWATPRPYVDPHSRFRTMSDRPGAAKWIIPEFHPYAPGKILAEIIQETFGRRP